MLVDCAGTWKKALIPKKMAEKLFKSPFITGFSICVLIALFIRYGISFVLFLLNRWQMSTVNTLIVYGLLFIIARLGMREKLPRKTFYDRRNPMEDMEDAFEKRSTHSSFRTAAWSIFGLYSILWITPGLILYWLYGDAYSNESIREFVCLLSVITVIIYFFTQENKSTSLGYKLMFFTGAFGGMVAVVYLTL